VKPREQRRKVVIKARMRVAESWGDALILNMSSRGLLIQSRQPPRRGTYVELRRGRHVIVARAVWAGEDRFGVLTQDIVPVDAVIHEPDRSVAPVAEVESSADRRVGSRSGVNAEKHQQSRLAGRLLEFACFVFVGAAAASTAVFAVGDALASPLTAVTAALD